MVFAMAGGFVDGIVLFLFGDSGGQSMSDQKNEIIREHHNENCEDDCEYVCTGCDRTFCDIKTEDGIAHNQELDYVSMDSGSYYHHSDCLSDCY